jgi:hypothetical protein
MRWKGKEQSPVKVSGYPFSYDKSWFHLLECGLCGVDGIGILVHARIRFGIRVIETIGWLSFDAMQTQHFLVPFQFGMQALSGRFRPFTFRAHRGNEAALLVGLDAVATRSTPVAFDLSLPTRQA